ncbi:MAG TPA: cobalt-precorrin 5A hydrolase [Clostridiales bacterium]|nr:cobalt-precorrin 5A hydrolase [Clostridiales bacterium]
MKIALCALTKNGAALACSMAKSLEVDCYLKHPLRGAAMATVFDGSLKDLIEKVYGQYDAFVMIMACGIAVRAFAPLLRGKERDPAVVVMDEKGQYAISLLSGHLGGANALTEKIAALTGAAPVITTATDINKKIAFDLFAKENDCAIENLGALKYISGALVNGEEVEIYSDFPIAGERPMGVKPYQEGRPENLVVISDKESTPRGEHTLYLRPRCLYLGCGCKKHTDPAKLRAAVADFLKQSTYSEHSLKALCSIDLKKEESCLLALAAERELPFYTFGSEELNAVAVENGSAFVEKVTGVKSVAEAAAKRLAAGETLIGKTVYDGITLSLAKREVTLAWNPTEKNHE